LWQNGTAQCCEHHEQSPSQELALRRKLDCPRARAPHRHQTRPRPAQYRRAAAAAPKKPRGFEAMGIPDGPVPREIPAATMDAVQELSDNLGTGLNRESLEILTRLCDYGVNPAALAAVVVELRKERDALAAAGDPDALARKEQDERERLERAEARDRRDD
jgi:mitotic-spindle organizing protein 1